MKAIARIVDELELEIIERKELLCKCKGEVYPPILKDEIRRLQNAKSELMKK